MTELLTMVATPVWAYLALFGFLTVDAMVPVVPTQAIMITSGALTVYGDLSLPLVIAIGGLGMFAGDSLAFLLGRSTGHVGRGWLAGLRARVVPGGADEPTRARRAAARFTRGLRQPGPLVLLLCRFVPGGRLAAGFAAGRTGYPVRLFIAFDGAAALGWASYGGLVGHVGGSAVTESAWRLLAIAATAAVVFGTAGWLLALLGGKEPELTAGGGEAGLTAGVGEAGLAAGGGDPGLTAGVGEAGLAAGGGDPGLTAARAASADAPPRRSTRTTTGR